MSSILARRLLLRLRQDLLELQDHPYPGVFIFYDDANVCEFCLVLTPPSGPFKNLPLHFDVVLPDNWPSSPPRVKSSVSGIDHPNLFGNYICCDLLKPSHWVNSTNYNGGYSPALTLRGLFLQFLTFFSSSRIEQSDGDTFDIGEHVLTSYIPETEFVARFFPMDGCFSPDPCHCSGSVDSQRELERMWMDSPSSEVHINKYTSVTGDIITHSAKQLSAQPYATHRFEKVNARWTSTYKATFGWNCTKCPYGSNSSRLHRLDPEARMHTTSYRCYILLLNDDLLGEIASHLPSEDIVSFGAAYPHFKALAEAWRILLQKELRCFFLRTSLRECILGVGVDLRDRTVVSDFDWLSKEAFDDFGVRQSVQKRLFNYFLPLAFNTHHFEQAQAEIWKRLNILDDALGASKNDRSRRPSPWDTFLNKTLLPPYKSVRVLYKMMNNIVVSLMKACDENIDSSHSTNSVLHNVSEKAITSYCHIFHLLLSLCRAVPLVLQEAKEKVLEFIRNPDVRLKSQTPDLGEFIVLITLVVVASEKLNSSSSVEESESLSWRSINAVFLEEAFTRNVRWVLRDTPELEVLEVGGSDYRLTKTFANSKTSLRLIMFQVTFLNLFSETYGSKDGVGSGIAQLDENYGFPEPELPTKMVQEIKEIYKLSGWMDFFERVQYVEGLGYSKGVFCEMLRKGVRQSAARGYHVRPLARRMTNLRRARLACDRMSRFEPL